MGTTYHYANLTKREWFSINALGGNSKLKGLGLSLTARGFELLLVKGIADAKSDGTVQAGRWAGDSITIIGDDDANWVQYYEEFVDLSADVILLVLKHDGFERIGEAAEDGGPLFMQLCHLVVTRQAMELEPYMKERFGTKFYQQYQEKYSQFDSIRLKDIARPKR